jgi:hypothetical protein
VISTIKKPHLQGVVVVPLHLREIIYLVEGTPLKNGAQVARYQTQVTIEPSSSGIDFPGAEYRIHADIGLTTAFGEPGNEDTRIRDFRKCLADVEEIVNHFASVL